MENLIKALNIFLKYGNPEYPSQCEHDTLMICGYDGVEFSESDIQELNSLGFRDSGEGWYSFRYGSA